MNTLTLLLQVFLGSSLLLIGGVAAFRPRLLQRFAAVFPSALAGRAGCALLFFIAGLATFAGAAVPFAAFFASCIALIASAVLLLLVTRTKLHRYRTVAALMAAASVGVAMAQPLGLKVLALPKADELPYEPVAARVIKTYDEGAWLEGVATGADGTLYMTVNRGLDFSRSDYYRNSHGEVLVNNLNGDERTLFTTPAGFTAGVIAVAADGSIYMTSHGESSIIWRIDASGKGERLAELPRGSWPNGLDIGPDGMLYSPDSTLGLVWRIDPKTGRAEKVIEDRLLLARSFISLAPGGNGLHFKGREMFVTVSDRTTVLKYTLDANNRFGAPVVVASGIPGDDFAIGDDGSLFITTHPYDTLVRVSPKGERTIIGKQAQHIVGATDAVFGKGANDRDTLYVVTDGGAFNGGPKARGQLVALKPYAVP